VICVRSMADFVPVWRARADELNLSHATIDEIAGLPSGYFSKVMCGMKNPGPIAVECINGALAIGFVVAVDAEQVERVQGRWVKRKRPQKLPGPLAGAFSIDNEVPIQIEITAELQAQMALLEKQKMWGKMGGKKGGKRRLKTMSKRARQRVASHAARMRWAKRHG
jgi:hypothetical protein